MTHTFALLFALCMIIALAVSFPIDILQERIVDGLVLTSDERDAQLQRMYNDTVYIDNGLYQIKPKAIVLAKSVRDVQATVLFCKEYNTSFAVKGGGHSAMGYSLTTDVVLSMKNFNKTFIVKDEGSTGLAYIEAGLRWMDVYPRLSPFVPVGGTCPHVGVMGFTLGGGYSMLSRSYGLGSDNVVEFSLVNANGEYIRANNETNSDLFWALRGSGGGNYGVVISMTSKVYRDKEMFTAEICWSFEEAMQVISFYNSWVMDMPNEMAAYGIFFTVPSTGEDTFCLTFAYNGLYSKGAELVAPFLSMGGKVFYDKEQTFVQFMTSFLGGVTDVSNRNGFIKSGLIDKQVGLNEGLIATVYKYMTSRPSKSSMFIWSHIGGRITDNVESSSFFRRQPLFAVEMKSIFTSRDNNAYDLNLNWIETFYGDIQKYFDGAYVNYIDSSLPNWREAYYGTNYAKLVQLKAKYDPTNLFHFAQSVGSAINSDAEIERVVHQFQLGQINRDINILSPLFAEDSVINIPIGSSTVKGKSNILNNFQTFFDTLLNMTQKISSDIVINANYAAYSKQITQFTKKGCSVSYSVTNWYQFDDKMQIKEFSAVFNLTHVIEQANCKP